MRIEAYQKKHKKNINIVNKVLTFNKKLVY